MSMSNRSSGLNEACMDTDLKVDHPTLDELIADCQRRTPREPPPMQSYVDGSRALFWALVGGGVAVAISWICILGYVLLRRF